MARSRWSHSVLALIIVLVSAGCGSATAPTAGSHEATSSPRPTRTPRPTPTPRPTTFATEAFAQVTEDPVSEEKAAELQALLENVAGSAGASATIMSAQGTWSGVTGTADGTRPVTVEDQFSIASTTKAVTAAQVMQLVEAGELDLDDHAADHLPPDLDFDANGATIRDLLSHRSGIPNYVDVVSFDEDPLRFWTPAELLAAIPADRTPPGGEMEYANVNYLLLGLVIEEVTGRPVAEVLRDGVLNMDGVERLIFQPAEVPTEPISFDNGRSAEWFRSQGGFLPSLALTSDATAAAMASDSVSLALWWRALCAGEIVSQASLDEMLPKDGDYGLGIAYFFPKGVIGHYGQDSGGVSLAGCFPETGVVFAVLANRANIAEDAPGTLIEAMSAP